MSKQSKNPKVEERMRKSDREYQRRKRASGLINKTEEYREWRRKNPKGAIAQQIVHQAIKNGKLVRGECELKDIFCSKGKIQAHHENYEEPLKVNWLCPSHHKKVDLGLVELNNKN